MVGAASSSAGSGAAAPLGSLADDGALTKDLTAKSHPPLKPAESKNALALMMAQHKIEKAKVEKPTSTSDSPLKPIICLRLEKC